MILKFKTKTDINGNTYYLQIDTNNRTYSQVHSFAFMGAESVRIGTRDRNKILENCINDGYTEED